MTPADILSLLGIVATIIVAWIIFRAQQKTDFNRLTESILNTTTQIMILDTKLEHLTKSNDVKDLIELTKELVQLRNSISDINKEVNSVKNSVISEVRQQQKLLISAIKNKIESHIKLSTTEIQRKIVDEISEMHSTGKENFSTERLIEIIQQAMTQLSNQQRQEIAAQSELAFQQVSDKLVDAVERITTDIDSLKEKVEAIPLYLPPPASPTSDSSML